MKETKDTLRINKFPNRDVYLWALANNFIGLQDLSLIQNDDEPFIVSVSFDSTNKKIIYTTNKGDSFEVVDLTTLKSALNYSALATSGSYNDATNKPTINGVELSGNKTTSDLGIVNDYNDATNKPTINGVTLIGNKSFNDLNITIDYSSLSNKPSINNKVLSGNISSSQLGIKYSEIDGTPSIPSITSLYSSSDESTAITGKGVSAALQTTVPLTRTVSGTGALSGGGSLLNDIQISHKLAPSELSPSASKVATDEYGHVQIGGGITAADVNAVPATLNVQASASGVNASFHVVYILGHENETLGFVAYPTAGTITHIYYTNSSSNALTLTIPSSIGPYTTIYVNGTKLTSNANVSCPQDHSMRIDISCINTDTIKYMYLNIN